ncbi:MAG: SDR family oxidoreductase [Methylophaga sp.]|uniref:SDR family NAD(P)-dependent oxidoreductase n=1 Tax=Methylophaga sp. TaxID=2024840 RepID=UPI00299D3D8A|nr:SDR family oxidoreductase [Methylophaga sp.]MDX1749203.1 SDR family oxidoreductase [Methylophaga sp.]
MNKIVLITGASRGLGKNMALHLADQGRDIIVTYYANKQEADSVVQAIEAKGRKAVALQLDVSNSESFTDFNDKVKQQLQTHWQRDQFDYLINNAGSGVYKTFVETTEADFDQMSNEHLKGPFFLTQKLLPLIKDGGRVLNVSSGLTRMAFPGFVAYAIMKAAVELLTSYLAKELGERRITVNTIAPGAIETDFGGGMVRDNKEINEHIAQITALGRVGLPDDIGGAVTAILSDDAGWINAQRIEASGGQGI